MDDDTQVDVEATPADDEVVESPMEGEEVEEGDDEAVAAEPEEEAEEDEDAA